MLRSLHALIAAASLAIAACTFSAPAAMAAAKATHVTDFRNTVRSEQLFRSVNMRIPNARAEQPRSHADDPFADLFLG